MNCLLKKFLLKNLNKFLDTYKSDVESSRKNVKVWLKRAETITKFLNMLSAQLEDGNISEDELKSTIEEFEQMLEGWKKERV